MQKLNVSRLVFLLIILLTVILLNNTHFQLYGDGNEYFQMIISLKNHFSPDLRLEDKLETVTYFLGINNLKGAYFTALPERGGGLFVTISGHIPCSVHPYL